MKSNTKPIQPTVKWELPKVYFLMIRTREQVKKIQPIPYKNTLAYKKIFEIL